MPNCGRAERNQGAVGALDDPLIEGFEFFFRGGGFGDGPVAPHDGELVPRPMRRSGGTSSPGWAM
jgi:hypothetical protein